jgi:polysaccharide export outer membrane protein
MSQVTPERPRVVSAALRAASPVLVALALLFLAMLLGALLEPHPAEAKRIRVPVAGLPKEPAAPESLAYYVDDLPYRVAPGDILNIDFGVTLDGRAIQNFGVLVRPDGIVTLNTVGDVRAAGLTTAELDSVLMNKYSATYRDPHITVAIAKLAGNMVHVLGEVRAPGSYEVLPNATVLQTIARAGGATNGAAMGNVILMRRTGPTSMVARRVKVSRAISQGLAADDPYVRRFDIIYVPRTTIANIDLFVEQHFEKLVAAPSGYITGWEAFHLDRVFQHSATIAR